MRRMALTELLMKVKRSPMVKTPATGAPNIPVNVLVREKRLESLNSSMRKARQIVSRPNMRPAEKTKNASHAWVDASGVWQGQLTQGLCAPVSRGTGHLLTGALLVDGHDEVPQPECSQRRLKRRQGTGKAERYLDN